MAGEGQVLRVPNAITARRLERGMMQTTLAGFAGVSPPDMNHIEAGRRLPNRTQLRRIARALKCKPEDLYAGSWLKAILDTSDAAS